MKLKKRIQITKRGYSILSEYCPGLIGTKVIATVIEALKPFVIIWFSARIINEIAEEKRIRIVILPIL